MSRAVRTARGTAGVLIATLIAAASHGAAGGEVVPFAIAVTAVLALPLCVALAGKLASLWRLSLAVTASQFLYHWSFTALSSGATSRGPSGGELAVSPHAAHLGFMTGPLFSPNAATTSVSPSAELLMWLAHGLATVVTVALLYRGERAALAVARLIWRALPLTVPRGIAVPTRPVIRPAALLWRPLTQLAVLTSVTHRGPPTLSAFAHTPPRVSTAAYCG